MSDFLDNERTHAERAHDPSRHCRNRSCVYEVGGRWSCEYPPVLADGTGRHSRKEMRKATGLAMPSTIPLAMDQELERQMMPPDAEPTGEHLPQCLFGYSGWWCREDCPSRAARENAAAQRVEDAADAAMDALERLMIEFGAQLDKAHTTPPQQRALRGAKLVLVEAGRRVR